MRLICANVVAGCAALVSMSAGYAGECPKEHRLDSPREMDRVAGKGVKVEVLEDFSIAEWRDMGNYKLRMRYFEIAPGATVATHSHADRPAIIYFISGEIFEHSTLCAVPILHKAGESTGEVGDFTHWWSNESEEPVILVSSDVRAFNP